MSEDDDEFKPRPRSPLQQKIADLMYKANMSYDKAYDLVMNVDHKPTNKWYDTPEPEVTVTDEVRQTIREIQQNIEKNKEVAARTNEAVRDFTVQGYLLDKLKQDVEVIEAEKENVEVAKAGWLRKKAKAAETARKIMKFAQEMDSWKSDLQKVEDYQNKRSQQIKETAEELKKIEDAIDGAVKKSVKEAHGYVKKISKSQLKEFEEN